MVRIGFTEHRPFDPIRSQGPYARKEFFIGVAIPDGKSKSCHKGNSNKVPIERCFFSIPYILYCPRHGSKSEGSRGDIFLYQRIVLLPGTTVKNKILVVANPTHAGQFIDTALTIAAGTKMTLAFYLHTLPIGKINRKYHKKPAESLVKRPLFIARSCKIPLLLIRGSIPRSSLQ
jgi:hypothetical protein